MDCGGEITMDKKQFELMISKVVRNELRKLFLEEIRPLIKETIKKQLHLILEKSSKNVLGNGEENNYSLTKILQEEEIAESKEPVLIKKPFTKKGTIYDILNKTAEEVVTGTGYRPDMVLGAMNEQAEIRLNTQNLATLPAQVKNLSKGNEIASKKQMVSQEVPEKILLPTVGPEGEPLNLSAVPNTVILNLSKNYKSILKKADEKAKGIKAAGVR